MKNTTNFSVNYSETVWKPHVTVAAIIEQNERFLIVEENTAEGIRFNQPAGHLEANENLVQAISREVQEETAWQFETQYLLGVQHWRKSPHHPTFLRFCFVGRAFDFDRDQALDADIVQAHWLTKNELENRNTQLRSPLVMRCIELYLAGQRYPLSFIHSLIDL